MDPADWTEDRAEKLAANQCLWFRDDHWFAIRFMRDPRQEHPVTPDARFAMRQLELRHPLPVRKRLFELFPCDHVAQACRIAGMKRPRA